MTNTARNTLDAVECIIGPLLDEEPVYIIYISLENRRRLRKKRSRFFLLYSTNC